MLLISDQSPNNEAKSGVDVRNCILIAFMLHHTLKTHVFIKKKKSNKQPKMQKQTTNTIDTF